MVSLWGSKKNASEEDREDHDGQNGTGSRTQRQERDEQPDERTHLLPPRGHDGYLDPDDPAVSPYNLWSIRALRYFSVLSLIVTFIWWVLLFVSIFVSPPGMHSRGSGFFDVSYTTLTAGYLLTGILFFTVPNKMMEYASLVLSLLLIVDMIIIAAVGHIRGEEGWVGLASVIWAAIIALYNAATNRVVAWGKSEEEERLTGRRETRRSLGEWFAVLISSILMILYIVVAILLTATLIIRSKDASLEAPGKLYWVDGDKYQVHLDCIGNITYDANGHKNPTILAEAGERPFEGSFDDWVYGAYTNGTIDRYCYWDRPGIAWSDNAPSPHSAGMSADALSEALAKAGDDGPWIVVAAGMGGVVSRIFSSRHNKLVKGIFLIDAMHEDLLYRIASPSRGFLLWASGIVSPLGLRRLWGAIVHGHGSKDRVYGQDADQTGKFIKSKLQENLVADSLTKNELVQARNIQDDTTALVVISSGIRSRSDEDWGRKQEDLTKITNNLVAYDIVSQAPHEVWETANGRATMEKRLKELLKAI